jgi:hypothetical protein
VLDNNNYIFPGKAEIDSADLPTNDLVEASIVTPVIKQRPTEVEALRGSNA